MPAFLLIGFLGACSTQQFFPRRKSASDDAISEKLVYTAMRWFFNLIAPEDQGQPGFLILVVLGIIMEIENWLLFSAIALVATITPGPAVLLVATHSLTHGVRQSVWTILGNISGLFVLSLLSVLGLGAMVLYSATAYNIIKIAGAAYLIYLGIRLWITGFSPLATPQEPQLKVVSGKPLRMYGQGLMVALSNPKAIAFTTALFPQFINRELPLPPQFSVLVATFMCYSFICLLLYSYCSATTRATLRGTKVEKIISRSFASLFIGSGVILGASS